ncbi:MAG: hypothetical protein HON76_14335 [Candidatus Scalindua sp.]|jgi:hypothetical protein|nr:hypothetical protein [Candidatus Scalindua sp.]MBT5305854.1 hypothetical protein [Candidatus Scalindua sp.]MBT6049982.1 hypothetical protein [Candidatus Scalindua sp.]MBT6230963.1 hypothetical protein [Candidatus Scalindua sp.]MBT6563695.1 hypothetical protein [Candidatus Scalindua sp.]
MKQTYTIARIFVIAIVVATILNGSSFWLKRVGWLEPQLYEEYKGGSGSFRGQAFKGSDSFEQLTRYTYQTKGVWTAFKASKDVIFLLFFIVSLLLILRKYTEWKIRYFWLFVSIAFLFLYAFCKSLLQSGPLLSMAGLRSFLFLGVVIVGSWAACEKVFYLMTKCLVVLILIQLLMTPYEYVYGMRFFVSSYFQNRIVGTMLQPSSFGIVLVLGLIWYFTFSRSQTWLWWLTVIVSVLAFFSGSATSLFLLLFAYVAILWSKIDNRFRKRLLFGGITGSVFLFLLLPSLTGRVAIYHSLWGRFSLYKEYIFTGSGWCELMFGRGLGAGTNTAVNLLMDWQDSASHGVGNHVVFVADSTPLMLISQIGFVGLFMVYGLLFLAIRNDPQTRIFYFSFILASLTVNITELFPINFILGLLLARSFSIVKSNDYTDRAIAETTKPVS